MSVYSHTHVVYYTCTYIRSVLHSEYTCRDIYIQRRSISVVRVKCIYSVIIWPSFDRNDMMKSAFCLTVETEWFSFLKDTLIKDRRIEASVKLPHCGVKSWHFPEFRK